MVGMRLRNKVTIVTGSRRGIGRAIALEMAKEGADVVVTDVDGVECKKVCQEIEHLGRKALAVPCDVSKRKDVENLIKKTLTQFGRIDILVNNAGVYRAIPFLEMKEHDWETIININLKGAYLCSQAALKEMVRRKTQGSIVNIASIAGEVGFANSAAYCASKGGMITLTKELALEFAANGIRVNAVGPGPIRTPMTKFISEDPKVLKAILAGVPMGRMGEPEEIAKAVVFLASDDASYITGHCLFADGGELAQ